MTDRERWLSQWGYIDGTPEAEAAWIAKVNFVPPRLHPLIMRDIEPYRAAGADIETGARPMITSRSQHRDYLRRNNYVEVGNEYVPPAPKAEPTKAEIAKDVKRAIEQTGARL